MNVAVAVPFRDGGCEWRRWAWERVEQHLAATGWPIIVVDDGGEPFSRGCSLNQAFATSTADVLVCCDADYLIQLDALRAAVDEAAGAPGLVQPLSAVIYCRPAITRKIYATVGWPENVTGELWDVSPTIPLLGACNVLSRETWELAGGWLPGFRGWGCEDIAFHHQTVTLAGPLRRIDSTAIHLYHPKLGDYAAPNTIARNSNLMHTVAAAAGDPPAMHTIVGAARG